MVAGSQGRALVRGGVMRGVAMIREGGHRDGIPSARQTTELVTNLALSHRIYCIPARPPAPMPTTV